MAAVKTEATLPAGLDEAWERVSDLANSGDWNTVHVDFPDGVPEPAEGASFKEKVTIMGMPGEVEWTITELSPPTGLAMEGVGPMGTTLMAAFRLEDDGEKTTKMTYETAVDGAALAAMAAPLEAASRKAAEDSLAKLKELLG